MSRFEAEGDWDERFNSSDSALALWEHNVDATVKGARGQRVLREMEAALLALPLPRLVYGVLATQEGDVCAIGALAKAKGLLPTNLPSRGAVELGTNEDWTETMDVGKKCGMSQTLAWTLGSLNDVEYAHMDEERRYDAVLRWVRERLKAPESDGQVAR